MIDGVSAKGLRQIGRLERTGLGPGGAAAALRAWQDFARATGEERADRIFYGHAGCCPDPLADRDILERVLRTLPPKDAKALRQRVDALDDRIGPLEERAVPAVDHPCDTGAVNDESDAVPYRRLPPRIRPTGTSQEVTPPAPAPDVTYVSSLSPAGELQAYEQAATFVTGTGRGRRLRTAVLVLLGLVALAVLAEKLF